MLLKNNRHQKDQRRQIESNFNDAPLRVDIRKSIRDLRRIYSEMTDIQFSKWYQKKYRVSAEEVRTVIADNEMH